MITPSVIIGRSGPLRLKTQANGVPRLQGVFTLRDQEGFPLDMAYEMAKDKGWDVDWVEAMADAARQCVFKYDALVEEIAMLEPANLAAAKQIFACGILSSDGESFSDKAQEVYEKMNDQ